MNIVTSDAESHQILQGFRHVLREVPSTFIFNPAETTKIKSFVDFYSDSFIPFIVGDAELSFPFPFEDAVNRKHYRGTVFTLYPTTVMGIATTKEPGLHRFRDFCLSLPEMKDMIVDSPDGQFCVIKDPSTKRPIASFMNFDLDKFLTSSNNHLYYEVFFIDTKESDDSNNFYRKKVGQFNQSISDVLCMATIVTFKRYLQ